MAVLDRGFVADAVALAHQRAGQGHDARVAEARQRRRALPENRSEVRWRAQEGVEHRTPDPRGQILVESPLDRERLVPQRLL